MDFVVGLPLTSQRHNAILVIVDKLTKSAHFIPVRDTYNVTDVAQVFISEVIRLHGLPTKIISDRDSRFISRFWTSLQSTLGTQLNLSTAYHPEIDGQTERVNQVMEDMLKIYEVEDQVFIYIQPNKSTIWFGKGTKLSPRFIGPFRIKEKIGPVAYHLVLPPHLHETHDVFHVSILRHYVSDKSHKLDWRELQVSDMGTVVVKPLPILDRRVRQLRRHMVDQVKVQWDKYSSGSATWEDAETICRDYPSHFEHL
eukprot:PITA_19272